MEFLIVYLSQVQIFNFLQIILLKLLSFIWCLTFYIIILFILIKNFGLVGIPVSFLFIELILFLSALNITMKIININFLYIMKSLFSLNILKMVLQKLNVFRN